jgi:hypothetical protein
MQVWSYVFIVTRQPKRVLRAVRQIPGVLHADAIFGTPDVIAIVTGIDVAAMDAVVDRIAEIPDVVETDTKIARWIDGVELPASRMTAEKMAPQLSAALLSEERPERGSGGGHPESNPVAAFRAAVAEAAVAFSRRHPVVRLSVGAAGAILFLVGGLLAPFWNVPLLAWLSAGQVAGPCLAIGLAALGVWHLSGRTDASRRRPS